MDYVPLPKTRLWKSKADFFRPFKNAAAEAGENILPLYDPVLHQTEVEEPDLRELNAALAVLVELFPDVEPEVFREMLSTISEESRLQVVTEQLLSEKAKWAHGRYRTPPLASKGKLRKSRPNQQKVEQAAGLLDEQVFRSENYKKAVKQVLYEEFRSLSHSSVRAVLAEQNFSYSLARPILQQISSKSWRISLMSFWPRRTQSSTLVEHPFIIWQPGVYDETQAIPAVKRTGSSQLDQELFELFVEPVLSSQSQAMLARDRAIATKLNEAEAVEVDAMFDCECCYNAVTFEELSVCNDGCHQLCFGCVRRTVSETLFGQGWARTVDLERSTVRCFAPVATECPGIIPSNTLHRALSNGTDNEDVWNEFQSRAAVEALAKSRLPLQRCPFCSYVEVDDAPTPRLRMPMEMCGHMVKRTTLAFQVGLLCVVAVSLMFAVPLILAAIASYVLVRLLPDVAAVLDSSWTRVWKKRRGSKFTCRSPHCSKTSCIRCLSLWRDPHTCFENEKTSLRTAIESSATAAVKRTCPRCMLSFVKSSGCNKLVCNCGYTMCYICRQQITSKEGYGHFCQHFRPHGGRCIECDRCDLYGEEDEEAAIRRAVEAAEKAWKESEGGKNGDETATRAMVDALVGRKRSGKVWESWLDAVTDTLVA